MISIQSMALLMSLTLVSDAAAQSNVNESVAHDSASNTLYVLDGRQRVIRSAPYAVGDPMPTDTWSVAITAKDVPPLASWDLGEYRLIYSPEYRRIGLVKDNWGLSAKSLWIDPESPASYVEILGVDSWPGIGRPGVGDLTLSVWGRPSDTVDLVRFLTSRSWEVLSSTVLDARGAGTFRMSEPLNYGEMLAAKNRALALPTSPFLTPIRRWGQPMDLDEGSRIKPLVSTIALDAPYSRTLTFQKFQPNSVCISKFRIMVLINKEN